MHFVLLCMVLFNKPYIRNFFMREHTVSPAQYDKKYDIYLEVLNALDNHFAYEVKSTTEIKICLNKLTLVCNDSKIISTFEQLINSTDKEETKNLLETLKCLLRKDLGL